MLSGRRTSHAHPFLLATLTMVTVGLCASLYVASGGELEHQGIGMQWLALTFAALMGGALMLGGEIATSTVSLGTQTLLWQRIQIVLGNLLGIAIVLIGVQALEGALWLETDWGAEALHLAKQKLSYGFWELVGLAALSNLGLCLAIWLSRIAEQPSLKLMTLVAPIWLFLNTGIEHVMVNLLLVPFGMVVLHGAPELFWQLAACDPDAYGDLTLRNLVCSNLIPVLLGNLVGGGGVVGLINLWLDRGSDDALWLESLDEDR
ncbi:formate/nitrite transporter family protein [Ferrimonas balearica]|uniref:formate/nitrite transporter family protein n=1 Tax=Ferrimonas balearica TaxID=44012 RepID=UPI001C96EDBB|nr:formate/nitrite transporter family protein [Ferrimonas balearica]MBY6105613.1 formate/nitrite transporter family protein [Ferrimonas balearica]